MTPLDGPPTSTRSGARDPGAAPRFVIDRGMRRGAVADLLPWRSGLLGISALSGDMEMLLQSAGPDAPEAVELSVYRAGRAIGSLAAPGRLDPLVFTA